MSRLLAVLVVLLAVTAADRATGLAAALVYGAAYTARAGPLARHYYGQDPSA